MTIMADLSVSDLLILVDGGLVVGKLEGTAMSLTKLGCKYSPEEIKNAAKRVGEAIGGMNVSLKRFRPAGSSPRRATKDTALSSAPAEEATQPGANG